MTLFPSVCRISVWPKPLPPTLRHPSPWAPSPTRSSASCAPADTLTRTSHPSSNSYARRKDSECRGGWSTADCDVTIRAHIHTHHHHTHPQCPLSYDAQETLRPCSLAQTCGPINILYVDTCPPRCVSRSVFSIPGSPSACAKMLKLTLDPYLETKQLSSQTEGNEM